MPAAFNAADHARKCLQLYRSLLRACSYLPDSVARNHIHRHIVYRFRNYNSRAKVLVAVAAQSRSWNERKDAEETLQTRLGKAQASLRTLEKANAGGLLSLQYVLRWAYGRVGKRRFELLKPLLEPDTTPGNGSITTRPALSEPPQKRGYDLAIVPISDIFTPPKVSREHIVYDISPKYSKLRAIILAQVNLGKLLPHSERVLRSYLLKIPTKNEWNRPMPLVRVKNFANKHYAWLLEKVLPPLPDKDWLWLYELATGTRKWEGVPKRRKRVVVQHPEKYSARDLESILHVGRVQSLSPSEQSTRSQYSTDDVEKVLGRLPQSLHHFDSKDTWLEDSQLFEQSKSNVLEEELNVGGQFAVTRNSSDDPHTITERYMKRQLKAILVECPRLSKDKQTGGWEVTSGIFASKEAPDTSTLAPLFDMMELGTSARESVAR
ncbi:hypothetical protein BT63DRAFT_274554 [Microthyrium microscopicum]|uniref:LYR motif-containing protein Cup1-like N-terminal domain-containing protein n=1 Tax=Microthyrium microscopicum TaxID=703497 RepID=A0A6A6U8T0_9PEZI|nr:hypothetical protein BT63DRAFT_274554 [Microthyrium microscopicum]